MPSHDDQLIEICRASNVALTRRRLHRWRLAGVFPSNPPGRPRANSPRPTEDKVALASFVVEHLRPGQGIEIVSLFAFGLGLPVPERGVRASLVWCARYMAKTAGVNESSDSRWDAIEAAGRQMTRMRNPLANEIRDRLRRYLRVTGSGEGLESVLWSTYTTLLLSMSGMEVSSDGMAELFAAMGYSESVELLGLNDAEVAEVRADFHREMSSIKLGSLAEAVESASWADICAARERVVRWFTEAEALLPAIEAEVPGAFGLPFFLEPAQRPIVIATQTLLSLGGVIHREDAT